MSADNFQFNFGADDAREAIAELGRRIDLARRFGIHQPDSNMLFQPAERYWYDQTTEHWMPHWWPEWAR